MEHQLVVFRLAEEDFGVDIGAVESIIKLQTITKVPHAPGYVEGVTNLRGSILPVIDLGKRFGLDRMRHQSQTERDERRIMVVSIGNVKVGMVVDEVSEVLQISDEAVDPPPPMVTDIDTAFITGIAKIADRLIICLDLKRVLAQEEVGVLEASF